MASPGLLAHIIVSKFDYHLPLYRQEKILQPTGIDIPRSTLSHWILKCAELLEPLIKLMQYIVQTYDVAYADETRVQILREGDRPPQENRLCGALQEERFKQFCILSTIIYPEDTESHWGIYRLSALIWTPPYCK